MPIPQADDPQSNSNDRELEDLLRRATKLFERQGNLESVNCAERPSLRTSPQALETATH